MCISPISIENKNYIKEVDKRLRMMKKFPYKDFSSARLFVPCGYCKECIRQRQDALVQRVTMESSKNHLFMATLTYQPAYLPTLVVGDYEIKYADVHDIQCMMKMLKKDNVFGIPFRYLVVSELGSRRGRPHFHILFLFSKEYFPKDKEDYIAACSGFASKSQHYFTLLNYWRRNFGSRRNPDWRPLTLYVEKFVNGKLKKNYDFHYINPFLTKNGVEDCGYYVLKYMFKPSDRAQRLQQALRLNLIPEEYERVWSIVKPRCFKSIGFGFNADVQLKQGKFKLDEDIVKKLRQDIDFSKQELDFPAFVHPFTGKPTVLANYYRKFSKYQDYDEDLPLADGTRQREAPVMTYQDHMDFWFKNINAKSVDNSDPKPYSKVKTATQLQILSDRYEKTISHVDSLGFDSDLDLLD